MTFKIEEGKFYRDGAGNKQGPMRRSGRQNWPWTCGDGSFAYLWREDGNWYPGGTVTGRDLVAEWPADSLTLAETNPVAADLLDAMKRAIKHLEKARAIPAGNLETSTFVVLFMDRIAAAEGRGIRAQSFAERERDLLEANNRYLEGSRAARARARSMDRLVAHAQKMAVELAGQLDAANLALAAVVPYAESRAEDMEEIADECEIKRLDTAPQAREEHAKAVAAVDNAKRLLGRL